MPSLSEPISEQQALSRLAALCARGEHSTGELAAKMRRWQMSPEAQARVIQRLTEQRFVDDERYARAFVSDKLRHNRWGRLKLQQALWAKGIDNDTQQRVLDELTDDDYVAVLRPLLQSKRRTLKADSDYELRQRLVRFARSHGFTYDVIRRCVDVDDIPDDDDDF